MTAVSTIQEALMSEGNFVPMSGDADYRLGSGLLGASVPTSAGPYALEEERLQMIERCIIRIEVALRRAGVGVGMADLDMAVAYSADLDRKHKEAGK